MFPGNYSNNRGNREVGEVVGCHQIRLRCQYVAFGHELVNGCCFGQRFVCRTTTGQPTESKPPDRIQSRVDTYIHVERII